MRRIFGVRYLQNETGFHDTYNAKANVYTMSQKAKSKCEQTRLTNLLDKLVTASKLAVFTCVAMETSLSRLATSC